MAGDKAPRSESRFRGALGFLYTQALTGNANTNQAGIRAIRSSDEGFQVRGHGHRISAPLDAPVDNTGATFSVDVSEESVYLVIIENNMAEPVTLDLDGSGVALSVPLESALVIAAGTQLVRTYTDPWAALDFTLTGPAIPTGANVVVEVLRRT